MLMAILVFFCSISIYADVTNSILYQSCSDYTDIENKEIDGGAGICLGYVAALSETYSFINDGKSCKSFDKIGDLARYYVNYVNNHSIKLNDPAFVTMLSVMKEKYPCS